MKRYLSILLILILVVGAVFAVRFYQPSNSSEIKNTLITTESTSQQESKDYISPISIDYLRNLTIDSDAPVIEEVLPNGGNYKKYVASYLSEGYKIFGLLAVPETEMPEGGFPAIVFNHGYIPPTLYKTTENYVSYVDVLARNGFVVFKIDYRGNGESEGDPSGSYFSSDYAIDAISALRSLQKHESVSPSRIGFWGHSMAGNLVLRSMLVSSDIKAGVIWAGAVYSYEDFGKYSISDNSYRPPSQPSTSPPSKNRETSPEIQKMRSDPDSVDFNSNFWTSISLTENINYLGHPIQLHHAVDDAVVNIGYSRDLVEVLKGANKDYEFYEYTGGGHNITSPHFDTAMQRTIQFFKANL